MTSVAAPLSIAAIQDFSQTLGDCLHDLHHEDRGDRLSHYWDDDSLFLPIRGLLAWEDSANQKTKERLAQSLFSAGFLGPVTLLAAHRAELIGQLARWSQDSGARKANAAAIASFLERPAVAKVLALSREIPIAADEGVSDIEERAKSLIGQLSRLEADSFSIIEASWGSWPTRLARMLENGLLELEPSGLDPASFADSPLFATFADDISRVRDGKRGLATALDAAALTELAQKCAAVRTGSSDEIPRFFTSSANLWHLLRRNPSWQQHFHYSYEDFGVRHRGIVWRNTDYYFMRSVFPPLRISPDMRSDDPEGLTIGALEDLNNELRSALNAGSHETMRLVTQYQMTGDNTLAHLVREFRSHQMAEVWLRYGSHEEVPNRLDALRRLEEFGALEVTRQVANRIEYQFLQLLHQELEDRKLSMQMIDAVHDAASSYEHVKSGHRLSLNEDLGSVRWGLEFPADQDQVTLEPRFGSGIGHADLLRLYSVDLIRNNGHDAERALAILVGLDRFDLADRLLNIVDVTDSESVYVIRIVVTICRRGHRTEAELVTDAQIVQGRWNSLSAEKRRRFALGYGFAAFAIWSNMAEGGAWRKDWNRREDLARWSLSIVRDTLQQSSVDEPNLSDLSDLRLAYSVNHIVYVATMAGLLDAQIRGLADNLESVAIKLDNYRFLDTVGCYLLSQARALTPESDLGRLHRHSLLERAVRHLNRASRLAPSDMDVRRHRDSATEILVAEEMYTAPPIEA